MRTCIPTHLSDRQLLEAVKRAAHHERGATALLVAHLAEMDARALHLGLGLSSLFEYCLQVLRLSESATCKRIDVARTARRFPALLDRLAEGALTLTSARLLGTHLTSENHHELIAAASGLRKRAVQEMLARRFPKPDVVTLVRKLPARAEDALMSPLEAPDVTASHPSSAAAPASHPSIAAPLASPASPTTPSLSSQPSPSCPLSPSSPPLPLATPLSAERYQIRFTASAATYEKLRVARDLLRHAVPSGDAGEIVDRALTALIDELAKKKLAVVKKPARKQRATAAGSRHVPAEVRRAVWARDKGRCAFVATSGRRCDERGRLELHHVEPYAVGGPPTVANIQLRCRAHNAYEAVLFYGRASGAGSDGLSARGSTGSGAGPGVGYDAPSAGPRGVAGGAAGSV